MIIRNKILKLLTLSISIILASTHVMQIIKSGLSPKQVTLILIVILSIAIIKESRKLYSLSFLLVGIFNILTLTHLTSLDAFLFFFISMLYEPNKKIRLLMPSILISCFIISYQINGFDNYINLIEIIIGNLVFLLFFYMTFMHSHTNIDHLSKVTPLTKRQLLILKYLALGVSRKEMPEKVPERELWKHDIDKFSFHIINSEIAEIKTKLDIESEFELGIWYNKKTEFSRNPSKS